MMILGNMEFTHGGFPFSMPSGKETTCPWGCDDIDNGLGEKLQEGWFMCKKCKRVWARIETERPTIEYKLYTEQFYHEIGNILTEDEIYNLSNDPFDEW